MKTSNVPIKTSDLVATINVILSPERFKDYCPNGLQVEGRSEIKTIVTGVTASMALLEAAKAHNADAILVHHGYFWHGEAPEIVGIKQKCLRFLLENDINLLAYHLPLDAHAEFGNNVQLGRVLGFEAQTWAGDNNIVAIGELNTPRTLADVAKSIELALQRKPQVIASGFNGGSIIANGNLQQMIKRVGWCTGAAQSYMEVAVAHHVDVFISGEISEQTVHFARESNTSYIAAGHHATACKPQDNI